MTANSLISETGKAVSSLYNLDIRLSNAYTGKTDSKHDQAVTRLRVQIKGAMDMLNTSKLLDAGRDMIGFEEG